MEEYRHDMNTTSCICCESDQVVPEMVGSIPYSKCMFCGFMFVAEEESKNKRNTVSNHYQQIDPHARVAVSKKSFFRETLDYLSSAIKSPERTLLDVGCGFGYFLEFAARNGWDTYGVEIVDIAVEAARLKVGQKKIFHGSLKEANYEDNYFDALTAWDVLVMVENPFEELKECYRIIKEKGKIGIRVRNVTFQRLAYRLYAPFRKTASYLNIKTPYVFHPYCFTGKSIIYLLQRAGFDSTEVINSPLTEGDPYSYTGITWLTTLLKTAVDLSTKSLYWLTGGRWVLGPSLIAWARKSGSKT